jgi:hypothetical protein
MDEHEQFKAFQAEFGAESAFIVYPDKTEAAFVRVFKDDGGLVRLGFQLARNSPDAPAQQPFQIAVGREQLMRLPADPQDPQPSYGPDA